MFSAVRMEETAPVYINDAELSPEAIEAHLAQITDWNSAGPRNDANQQVQLFVEAAMKGIKGA
ncbi:hypothetical protein D3C81_2243090 [compost metagenome]